MTYGRAKAGAAMGAASAKIGKLREDRLSAPAAPMAAFTEEERAALVD